MRGFPPWLLAGVFVLTTGWSALLLVTTELKSEVIAAMPTLLGASTAMAADPSPNDWQHYNELKDETFDFESEPPEDMEPVTLPPKRRENIRSNSSGSNASPAGANPVRRLTPNKQPLPDAADQGTVNPRSTSSSPADSTQGIKAMDTIDQDGLIKDQDDEALTASFDAPETIAAPGIPTVGTPKAIKRNKLGWSGWFTMSYPLNRPTNDVAFDDRINYLVTPSLTAAFKYQRGKWYYQMEFFKYFDEDAQGTWDPDFAYSFGYKDWRKNRLSLYFYNGGRNRLNPNSEEITGHYSDVKFTHFEEGTLTLRYNVPIPKLPEWLSVTKKSSVGAYLRFKTTPRVDYWNYDLGEFGDWDTLNWHQSLSLYSWYNITNKFYVATSLFYYPEGHQMPWHPDFTYEFGLADWTPGRLSLEYGNYSENNRFPGSKDSRSSRFFDGSLSLSLYWAF